MVKIVIPLPPKPKGRPRFTRSGVAYTPKETREYEDIVRMHARRGFIQPLRGSIYLTVHFYCRVPKSWPEVKKRGAEMGEIRPAVKPDIDNLGKAVLDGLNGIAYEDDKQVVELELKKFYGEPRTEIFVEEL